MNPNRPIVIIEDDPDDVDIITTAVKMLELPNPIVIYSDSSEALQYLSNNNLYPVLVISDVNLPRQSGIDLYKDLIANPGFASKRIPYVFLSTSPQYASIASKISGCGYFVKPRNYFDYVGIVQRIVLYWMKAEPNNPV